MDTGYEAAYRQLNTAQRGAVEVIDGPVLVVAGPGTGKTQLLSMRVANILKNTDTYPSAILCLTFTNKAATNMRDRLAKLVGPNARDVMVKTFHSFAAEIMNSQPDYFWHGARLSVAPDAVQLEIVESILEALPLASPLALKFAGQFTAVKDVQQALKLVKEAGLTPAKLRAIIKLNLAYINEIEPPLVELLAPVLSLKKLPLLRDAVNKLPEQGIDNSLAPLLSLSTVIRESLALAAAEDEAAGRTTSTGVWKRRWVQTVDGQKGMFAERKRNDWWLNLADVYDSYRKALHSRGYYDYADMLVEVITQMEKHADLKASVQERFLYVLIDEFQDTNAAQLRLSHLVADHYTSEGKPNIMAVGDDDQSIYKFNGAELNNMLSFQRTYPHAQLFVLTDNYRSSQAVLDVSQKVIELAHDRLVKREPSLVKELRAANPPKSAGKIEHLSYPSREHQLSATARLIKAARAKQKGSIAVLARGHESLRLLAGSLAKLNVPLSYEQSNDIFAHQAIRQIVALSKLVVAIAAGDEATVNQYTPPVLRHPMWQLSPEVLWHLAVENFSQPHWLDSLVAHDDKHLQEIGQWLHWLAAEADYQPLVVMLEYLIGLRASEYLTSPLRQYYLSGKINNDYVAALSAIKLLEQLADDFALGSNKQLSDFVRFVELMQANGQVVADESPFISRTNAVELLTVYKAKGLEFDSVFVIDAVEKNWQPRSGGRKPPANLPLQPNGDDDDDYVRLMYVALTRAKRNVLVTSYRSDAGGNEVLATPLIRSAITAKQVSATKQASEPIVALEEALSWPRLPQRSERQILRSRLDNYILSATHLLNFLDVSGGGPAYFLERNLLGLPQAQTPAMAFGSAAHSALEFAQIQLNTGKFELRRVLRAYRTALLGQRLPQPEFERYLKHGQNVLANLFENLNYQLPTGSLPEQKLTDLQLGEARLGGTLDRLDQLGLDKLVIVDYKTGASLSSFSTRDQTKQIKAWRHKTQLSFYTLLVRQSPRFKKTKDVEGRMVYLEAEKASQLERSFTASSADLERLSQLISAVWQRITKLQLPDVSRYPKNISGILEFEKDLIDNKL